MKIGSLVLQIGLRSQEASAWITSSSRNPGESCSLQTAPQQPVVAASNSDSELEELLRDTPEPSTVPVQSPTPGPPLTPGAARITEEASYGTTEDVEAVFDELQAWVENTLVKGLSSSETSLTLVPYRTPSLDIKFHHFAYLL